MTEHNAANNRTDLDALEVYLKDAMEIAVTNNDGVMLRARNVAAALRVITELRTARLALSEVFHAYVDEFGPDSFAEPTWPAYRFQIAIEGARILSDNVIPTEHIEV